MKYYILFAIALFISFSVASQQKFYVGAYTSEGAKGISLCELNLESGDLTLKKTIEGIDNPSFLKLSSNKKYLYTVSEVRSSAGRSGGVVVAYKRNDDGSLCVVNRQSSNGDGPCHVDVSADGKFVATATYGGGTTSLYPVAEDGSLKEATCVMKNSGSGPNEGRQRAPHAHSIKFSPFCNQVFSADLGTDHLDVYTLDKDKLTKKDQAYVALPPGAGPRHFDFHPTKKVIYVINELNSTVSCLRNDDGEWKVFQNISTLPDNFEGKSYCADIHISKDGKYLYGSNRGHNSIVVYEVSDEDQTLERLGNVNVEGNWPRNFALSPNGDWMLVANQKSNNITVFKINAKNGVPKFWGKKIDLPSPVCIEFL